MNQEQVPEHCQHLETFGQVLDDYMRGSHIRLAESFAEIPVTQRQLAEMHEQDQPEDTLEAESSESAQFIPQPEITETASPSDKKGRLAAVKEKVAGNMVVTTLLSTVPTLQYFTETPAFAGLFHRFAPEGFTDVKGAAISIALLGGVALSNFITGNVARKLPHLTQSSGDGKAQPEAPESSNRMSRGIKTIRTLGNKAMEYAFKPLELAGGGMKKGGNWLNQPKRAKCSKVVGKLLVDSGAVVTLGAPWTIQLEQDERAKEMPDADPSQIEVSQKRIAELSLLFAVSWFPSYDAVAGAIKLLYKGLDNVPQLPGVIYQPSDMLDVGLHDAFREFGSLFDITTPHGKITFGLLASLMAGNSLKKALSKRKSSAMFEPEQDAQEKELVYLDNA